MVHIIGSGPTGMALAWELRQIGQEVTIYERKPSAGGSWWEPDLSKRDLHAHRILFDHGWVNARNFLKELGIPWTDLFERHKDGVFAYMFKTFTFKDYLALLTLPFVAKLDLTLKDALKGRMSPAGEKFMEHLPLIIDGITWDVMSSYEMLESFNHVAFSKQWTQKVSGKVMGDRMQAALEAAGVRFEFNKELKQLEMSDEGYVATFADDTRLTDDLLVLCVDHSPAIALVGDNWGPDAQRQLRETTYGCINVLIDYPKGAPELKDDLEIAANTPWKLQPRVLSDGKTLSCVICNLTEEILTTDPETLKRGVLEQLAVPPPDTEPRVGWGSTWDGERWQFHQSSGTLCLEGQLPFFGRCPSVALCGMMSQRATPYASFEAAVEVARRFSSQTYGTRTPLQPFRLSTLLILLLIVFVVLVIKRNASRRAPTDV